MPLHLGIGKSILRKLDFNWKSTCMSYKKYIFGSKDLFT